MRQSRGFQEIGGFDKVKEHTLKFLSCQAERIAGCGWTGGCSNYEFMTALSGDKVQVLTGIGRLMCKRYLRDGARVGCQPGLK
jgi:hypothetical protein